MKKQSKRYRKGVESFELDKVYTLEDAVQKIKAFPKTKFDETVDVNIQLGIDVKKAEQSIRGSVALPHGTGKSVRVLAFCRGEEGTAAKAAGAEYVGADDLIQKVAGGWLDFDVIVAHPDMMRDISKLGRVLGPKGLMPTPKTGTVTKDLGKAVTEIKKGRIEFKSDKSAGVHVPAGKVSFDAAKLVDNVRAVVKAIVDAKPQSSKGAYLKSIFVSSSMGAGYRLDPSAFGDSSK